MSTDAPVSTLIPAGSIHQPIASDIPRVTLQTTRTLDKTIDGRKV